MKGRYENITGNLQIKNGKYYVLVNLYDLSGRRTVKWVALGLDSKCGKKLARARMAEILEEYNSSQRRLMKAASKKKDPERFITERERVQQMPITEFLREWVKLSENRLQPTTIDGYNKMIDGRITDYFGENGTTVGDLAGEDLNEFYACLQRSGLSATSALRFHGLFHAALKYAVKKEFLDDNPCDHADRPKQERYRASFYSEGEVRALLEAAKGESLYIPIMLAAYYGLRRSEALGVKWSNIDFTAKTVSISHKVIEARENGRFKPKGFDKMKNKSSNRTLPLIPKVEKELTELRIRQQANAKIDNSNYVCHNEVNDIDYIASDIRLSNMERQLVVTRCSETVLQRAFKKAGFISEYDYVIIDCPPALSLLLYNALCAADYVLVPVMAQMLALDGVPMLLDTVSEVQENVNSELEVLGYITTVYEKSTKMSRDIEDTLKDNFGDKYLGHITKAAAAPTSSMDGKAFSVYKKTYDNEKYNQLAAEYKAVAEHIIKAVG